MSFDNKRILIITFLLEGGFVAAYAFWIWLQDVVFCWHPSLEAIVCGAVLSLPVCGFSFAFFGPYINRFSALRTCRQFRDEIVRPLAAGLTWTSAVVVSILAGVGEEMFFRGLVQSELGIVIASVLFGLLHFGPAARQFAFVVFLYVVIGLYFGLIVVFAGDLWVAVIAHSVYDIVAFAYMKLCLGAEELAEQA